MSVRRGKCVDCRQELLLSEDDCWHPHTVARACPPEPAGDSEEYAAWLEAGNRSLRPGRARWREVLIGDQVLDATGAVWTVLNSPIETIPGAESSGLYRRETPPNKRGAQQYGEHIPGPLVVWGRS